jgi:penicillin-insensitive murein DD-endopeptidase
MRATVFVLSTALCSGCFSAPTPLAPGLAGSVGMPNSGVQTGAIELPVEGPGFARYRPNGKNHWGRPRLVQALQRIAGEIDQELPGGVLVIGDLGAKNGGQIPGHASHRSGRDVDLLFYAATPAGAPIASPGFVRYEADGLAVVPDSGDYVRLDLARQWLLVKKLVTAPELGVQFLFVSRPVEALLSDYARARGEPLELVYHAQTVMLQPGDSLPHDDHLHLRIACSPDETQSGCSGGGPYWEWLPPLPPSQAENQALLEAIADDEPVSSPDLSEPSRSAEPGPPVDAQPPAKPQPPERPGSLPVASGAN